MRKIAVLLSLMAVIIVFTTGCKKEEDNPTPSGGTMSLKADGTEWSATLAVVASNSGGIITVTGSDSNAHQAQVIVMGSSTGTYQIVQGGANSGRWTTGLGQNDTYSANGIIGSGTITITELTATSVSGTFSFQGVNTAQNTVSVTDGQFSANF